MATGDNSWGFAAPWRIVPALQELLRHDGGELRDNQGRQDWL